MLSLPFEWTTKHAQPSRTTKTLRPIQPSVYYNLYVISDHHKTPPRPTAQQKKARYFASSFVKCGEAELLGLLSVLAVLAVFAVLCLLAVLALTAASLGGVACLADFLGCSSLALSGLLAAVVAAAGAQEQSSDCKRYNNLLHGTE